MLLDLHKWGASVQLVRGPGDVSLARSIVADAAQTHLAEHSYLEYVLLLDNDIWSSPEAVRRLMQISQDLAITLGHEPSVSGLYLNRHKHDKTAAAHKLRDTAIIPCGVDLGPGNDQPVAVHALCGLGAFLMPARSLIAHCEESPKVYWPDRSHKIPVVCRSGPVEAGELAKYFDGLDQNDRRELFWHGEDFDFCAREITMKRSVLVAPVLFRHTTEYELDPVGPVTFPGLFAAKPSPDESQE
jgi:hypothetical protein